MYGDMFYVFLVVKILREYWMGFRYLGNLNYKKIYYFIFL